MDPRRLLTTSDDREIVYDKIVRFLVRRVIVTAAAVPGHR